jgi:hypothetical protein
LSPEDTPTADDFSKKAIRKHVFSEAVQHPGTIFSAAVAILSGVYMGLVSFDETSFAVAAGGAVFSLLSWVYHYFIRGDKVAAQYVKDLQRQRDRDKEQQGEDIERKCRAIGFYEGEQAAAELKQAYMRLFIFLNKKFKKNKTTTAQRFMVLAEETYSQGILFLKKALSLYMALRHMDEPKLKKELQDWVKERDELKTDEKQKPELKKMRLDTVRDKIRSHRKRLELCNERKETLKQVLAQCEVLEATLDNAYLEVVDLIEDDFRARHQDVAGKLEKAVAAARRVEDRLRGLGKEDTSEDDIYLKAAENGDVKE